VLPTGEDGRYAGAAVALFTGQVFRHRSYVFRCARVREDERASSMTNSNGRSNGRKSRAAQNGGSRKARPVVNGAGALGGANGGTAKAVVLAGGRGTRLAPYTSILPKPLMPIGDRAILEIVVEQLVRDGFTDIAFSVGYLSHLIRAVFDHSANPDASIRYIHEEQALGTAGPLRLVDGLDETFLAMNGDVLTTLDYRTLVRHHEESGNLLTVATHQRIVKIDYGVLYLEGIDSDSGQVQAYEEKPEISSLVSMGVYVLEPEALEYIPYGSYCDIPDLVQSLLEAGKQVGAFTYDGLWFDIGRKDDYEVAVEVWGRTVNEDSPLEREQALV
jgi:NDP-mannose synthase